MWRGLLLLLSRVGFQVKEPSTSSRTRMVVASTKSPSYTICTGRLPKAHAWSIRPHRLGVMISPLYAYSMTPRVVILRSYSLLKARVTSTQMAAEEDRPFFNGRVVR